MNHPHFLYLIFSDSIHTFFTSSRCFINTKFQEHFPGKDDPDAFKSFIESVYVKIPGTDKMEELRDAIRTKSLKKPTDFVVTPMRCDQLGAYGNRVVYLNQRLVLDAEYLSSTRWLLLLTLLHESGHYLDDLISWAITKESA